MAEPPVWLGVLQATVSEPAPGVTELMAGAPGVPAGAVTPVAVFDAGPVPAELIADTR